MGSHPQELSLYQKPNNINKQRKQTNKLTNKQINVVGY